MKRPPMDQIQFDKPNIKRPNLTFGQKQRDQIGAEKGHYYGLFNYKLYHFLSLICFFVTLCLFDHDLYFLLKFGLLIFSLTLYSFFFYFWLIIFHPFQFSGFLYLTLCFLCCDIFFLSSDLFLSHLRSITIQSILPLVFSI